MFNLLSSSSSRNRKNWTPQGFITLLCILIALYLSPILAQDCNGDLGGSAVTDCGGTCCDGLTNVTCATIDCNVVCCGGTSPSSNATCSILNSCNICVPPGGSPTLGIDCDGECQGEAVFDDCDVCCNGTTLLECNLDKDDCGICDGNNT